jgi:hypothetical protein
VPADTGLSACCPVKKNRSGLTNRWGVLLLVAGRYIEGLKQTLGLISGVLRMAPGHFLLANVMASLCWAVPLALIPYWIGQHGHQFLQLSKKYRLLAYLVMAGIIFFWPLELAYFVSESRDRKRKRQPFTVVGTVNGHHRRLFYASGGMGTLLMVSRN